MKTIPDFFGDLDMSDKSNYADIIFTNSTDIRESWVNRKAVHSNGHFSDRLFASHIDSSILNVI
jgi:hypothetical protein